MLIREMCLDGVKGIVMVKTRPGTTYIGMLRLGRRILGGAKTAHISQGSLSLPIQQEMVTGGERQSVW